LKETLQLTILFTITPVPLYDAFSSVYSMSKSDYPKNEGARGEYVQQFIYRLPKKNHEAMMKIQKQFNDIFRKHGVQNREVFLLGDTQTVGPFINIANTISSNQNEEEVLTALVYYRERKHRDDLVLKIQNDENYRSILQEFKDLLTPESGIIIGEFSRLEKV
jgi:uncharacterized protein YbaA (DUF1428 family)